MSTFKDIETAQEFFAKDRFATQSGMVIDQLGENWAVCSVELSYMHKNAAGGVMGGVIFTLADFAFAVAANNVHKTTVAQTVSVNFLSGTRGTRLFARSKCVKDGKNTCVYNIDVSDDLNRDIAQIVITGYKQ